MVIKVANIVPAIGLFIQFIVPFARWATNVIQDGHVDVNEAQAGVREFWPKRDADGNPVPVKLFWARK